MIGKTVGHYRIAARLGAGGMGEVFLAEDTRLDRKAAIKFLPAEVASDPDRRGRFLTEAKAASALNHPHVCVVYDVGETEDGLPFIAMEFVEGLTLSALVNQGRPEIARVVQIAVQVADALDAAHSRRIVHRDIKPENININERGEVSGFYRAMSLFRQGKRDEARKLAIETARRMEPFPKDEQNPLANGAYYDTQIMWLAYKEANAMIKFDAALAAPVQTKAK
jgi:serine/threonine protein kinase